VEVTVKKLRKPAIVYILCITSMVMINRTHNRRTLKWTQVSSTIGQTLRGAVLSQSTFHLVIVA